MVVYKSKKNTDTVWNRKVLIAIRDFEKKVKLKNLWKQVCLVAQDRETDTIKCDKNSFASPLSLFSEPDDLETLSDA